MRDMNLDWCFEGGCTYLVESGDIPTDDWDIGQLEARYREPCIGAMD